MRALLLSTLLFAGAAMADDAILKCRALGDGAARLACYDAIDVKVRTASAAAVASPASPAAATQASFGLPAPQAQEEIPKSIASTIAGDFDGWGPGARIALANGQVWRVTDGSTAVLPRTRDPKVSVTRGLLGGSYLRVEGSNQTARVSRVQ